MYEDESVTLCSRVSSESRCVHSHDKIIERYIGEGCQGWTY